jgi:hypothetical protein
MNYDENNCILFLEKQDLIFFLKKKILETKIELSTLTNFITNTKDNFFKNLMYNLQYDVDIYIFKHLIISTGTINDLHVILVWKTVLNYGIIDEDIDNKNLILRIEFRTIQKDDLFIRLEWFEFIQDINTYYDKNEFINSSIKYIFNYATYLKINSIKVNNEGIITKGFIEKFIKNDKNLKITNDYNTDDFIIINNF